MVLSLELLRIFAVVAVLVFHANPYWLPNGYLGVDIFFVISGYLMMSISLNQRKQFSILEFLWRRWARLFPLLLLTVAVAFIFVLFTAPPFYFDDYLETAKAAPFFLSNIAFWKGSGYFNLEQKLDPLLHTWSLSIEFQFYVIFAFVFAVFVRFSAKIQILFVLAVICFSTYLYITMIGDHPSAVFYLLPTRAWEFAVGCIVALLIFHQRGMAEAIRSTNPNKVRIITTSCYFVYFFTVAIALKNSLPGVHINIMVVTATAILILFTRHALIEEERVWHRFASFLGALTYPLYLTHYPVFLFFKESSLSNEALGYFAMFSFAILTAFAFLKFDQPARQFLYSSTSRQRAIVFASSVIASSMLFVASENIKVLNDQLFRANADLAIVRMNDLYASEVHKRSNIVDDFTKLDTDCWSAHRKVSDKFQDDFSTCLNVYGPPKIIFGDSHSEGLFFLMYENIKFREENPFVMGIFSGGCRLDVFESCFFSDLAKFVDQNAVNIDQLYYHQAGFYLMKSGIYNGGRTLFTVDNEKIRSGIELDIGAIETTAKNLEAVAGSFDNVTWVGPWMDPFISRRIAIGNGCHRHYEYSAHTHRAYISLDTKLDDLLGSQFVSLNDMLQFDLSVDFGNCDEIYWSDTDHMTLSGFQKFAERLDF